MVWYISHLFMTTSLTLPDYFKFIEILHIYIKVSWKNLSQYCLTTPSKCEATRSTFKPPEKKYVDIRIQNGWIFLRECSSCCEGGGGGVVGGCAPVEQESSSPLSQRCWGTQRAGRQGKIFIFYGCLYLSISWLSWIVSSLESLRFEQSSISFSEGNSLFFLLHGVVSVPEVV